MTSLIAVVLGAWLALVLFLGAAGVFARPPGEVPLPIAIGVAGPLVVFLAAFRVTAAFRAFVMALDLPLITGIQAWRFVGFGFLALYAHGILPGVFAWPAGLGDMAIGLTAPWLAHALVRRPGVATSKVFVVWNLLGMLDLVVAVSIGALGASRGTGAAAMAGMPLVLVPAYFVPFLAMLHLSALFQARRMRRLLVAA